MSHIRGALALVGCLVAAGCAGAPASDVDAVRAALDSMHVEHAAAYVREDVDALMEIYTEDPVIRSNHAGRPSASSSKGSSPPWTCSGWTTRPTSWRFSATARTRSARSRSRGRRRTARVWKTGEATWCCMSGARTGRGAPTGAYSTAACHSRHRSHARCSSRAAGMALAIRGVRRLSPLTELGGIS